MSRTLAQFFDGFVLPLLGGGEVIVGGPVRPREHRVMAAEMSGLHGTHVAFLRARRASLVVAEPELPEVARSQL